MPLCSSSLAPALPLPSSGIAALLKRFSTLFPKTLSLFRFQLPELSTVSILKSPLFRPTIASISTTI